MIFEHQIWTKSKSGFKKRNDPSKYRCIGLLNHEYKILSHILLARLLLCSESHLQDWQAVGKRGFVADADAAAGTTTTL